MVLANFFWVSGTVVSKTILRQIPYLAYAQMRILGATLCFAVLFFIWRGRPRLNWRSLDWPAILILAVTGSFLNHVLFFAGLARTSVVHSVLIVSLGPVMVLVLSCLLRMEDLTVMKFIGMLVSFGGVATLTMYHGGRMNGGQLAGDLILLLNVAVAAVYALQLKKISDRYDSVTLNTLTFGLGSILMLSFGGRSLLELRWSAIPPTLWWGLLYVVLFGTVLGFIIYFIAMRELSVSRVQAFSYLQPAFGTLLGIMLLGERLTPRVVIGGSVILLGVYLTERERNGNKQKSEAVKPKPASVRSTIAAQYD